MSPSLSVDLKHAVPVYEQIRSQLAGFIGSGDLQVGERLPSVRALAADLGIAVNTVGRAYSELERAGLVASGRRSGTVVAEQRGAAVPDEVRRSAREFARSTQLAGLSDDVATEIFRAALRDAKSAPGAGNLRSDPPTGAVRPAARESL